MSSDFLAIITVLTFVLKGQVRPGRIWIMDQLINV